jgi:hypothetical protein
MLAGLDLGAQLDIITSKVRDLEGLVRDVGTTQGMVAACICTRGLHLSNQLRHFASKEQAILGPAIGELEDLRRCVDRLLSEVGNVEGRQVGPAFTTLGGGRVDNAGLSTGWSRLLPSDSSISNNTHVVE